MFEMSGPCPRGGVSVKGFALAERFSHAGRIVQMYSQMEC